MFLGSQSNGNHGFQIGSQNRPDADLAGILNDLRRFGLAGFHHIMETFERDIETDVLSVPKAIDDSLGWIKNGNRRSVDCVVLNTERKGSRPEPHSSDWRIVDLGLSCFRTYGEPNLARYLKRQVMELKGGDEANDPFGYKLRNFGKIVRCCHFSIGELVESAGDASKGLFI